MFLINLQNIKIQIKINLYHKNSFQFLFNIKCNCRLTDFEQRVPQVGHKIYCTPKLHVKD